MWGLDPDTLITGSLGGYRKRGFSHGVEDGNDFSNRVVSRSHSLLVINVRHHIGRIYVVEHHLIGCDQNSDGSDG